MNVAALAAVDPFRKPLLLTSLILFASRIPAGHRPPKGFKQTILSQTAAEGTGGVRPEYLSCFGLVPPQEQSFR
jgi:hypothetical protein